MDNINAQPHALMNEVKSRLEDNWEYVKYDLAYEEFKVQVNVYVKNRRHALKLLIEVGGMRLDHCAEDHGENMKRFIASDAKQREAMKNHAMRTLVSTPHHFGHGGDIGVVGRLVRSK